MGGTGLAAQVDQVYFSDWLAEEVGAEALEFFDGVGGVEGGGGVACGGEVWEMGGDEGCSGTGRGVG